MVSVVDRIYPDSAEPIITEWAYVVAERRKSHSTARHRSFTLVALGRKELSVSAMGGPLRPGKSAGRKVSEEARNVLNYSTRSGRFDSHTCAS